MTDQQLLAHVAAGDRTALAELHRRHAGWLLARLRRRSRDDELVDLAVADTFVAAWRHAGTYRGTGDVGAWLWRIAVRKLIDQSRRRRPVPIGEAGVLDAPTDSAEDESLAAGLGTLETAFGHLAPELRQVLLATVVDGLTTKEAGVLLGIPQGTVKTRAARARAELLALLEGER